MRISLWWSFYVRAADGHDALMRHVPQIEAALGHRLYVDEAAITQGDAANGHLFHIDATSHLDAENTEQAAAAVLQHALLLTPRVKVPFAFNPNPSAEEPEIVALYWDDCAETGMPEVRSSGVIARFWPGLEPETWQDLASFPPADQPEIEAYRNAVLATPLIRLGPPASGRHDYQADFDLRIYAATSARLLEHHWPGVRKSWFNGRAELIQVAKRAYDRGPFRLKVRKYLEAVTEDQAIASCLRYCASDGLSLTLDGNGAFQQITAQHATQDMGVSNIVSYTLTRL